MVAAWRGALRALKALLEGSDLDLSDKDKRTGSTSDIFHPALLSSGHPTQNHSVVPRSVTAPGPVCSFSLGSIVKGAGGSVPAAMWQKLRNQWQRQARRHVPPQNGASRRCQVLPNLDPGLIICFPFTLDGI